MTTAWSQLGFRLLRGTFSLRKLYTAPTFVFQVRFRASFARSTLSCAVQSCDQCLLSTTCTPAQSAPATPSPSSLSPPWSKGRPSWHQKQVRIRQHLFLTSC